MRGVGEPHRLQRHGHEQVTDRESATRWRLIFAHLPCVRDVDTSHVHAAAHAAKSLVSLLASVNRCSSRSAAFHTSRETILSGEWMGDFETDKWVTAASLRASAGPHNTEALRGRFDASARSRPAVTLPPLHAFRLQSQRLVQSPMHVHA